MRLQPPTTAAMSSSSQLRPAAFRSARLDLARRVLTVIVAIVIAGAPLQARAQGPTPTVVVSDTVMEIRLNDGSVLYGRITAIDADRVTITTESGGRSEVGRAQIVSVRPTGSRLVNGERWLEDPNITRLFFGPTGRAIGRGTGYFAVYELLMPFLSYGVTDRFSLSGGTPVLPFVMGEIMYFAPKLTLVSQPGMDLAAGVLAFVVPSDEMSLGLVYGVGTFGSPDNAFTVGVGLPFITDEGDNFSDRVVLMLGGESRISQRMKFIAESYFVPGEEGGLVAGGVRFFGERLSADAGLGFAVGEASGCCVPIVNFVYSFGRPR